MAITKQEVLEKMKKGKGARVQNTKTCGVSRITPDSEDPTKPLYCTEEEVALISEGVRSKGRRCTVKLENLIFTD